MLRITVVENALEDQWTLQGTLTKGSVAELLSSWRASACPSGRRRIVNLDKVTSIDKSGEEALSMIMREGATVVASGVYTRHLLDELRARETSARGFAGLNPELTPAPGAAVTPVLEKPSNGSQKRILRASWTLKGSPGPMPGE